MADDTSQSLSHEDAPDSFNDLIRRAREGDQQAVGALMEKWRGYLMLVANEDLDRELQGKIASSDVVQQSMLDAAANLEQFRGESENEFRAWLRQILCNDLRDVRRKNKRSARRRADREQSVDDSQGRTVLYDNQTTPGTNALLREQAAALHDAMREMPEHYRQVIQLRNWEGHSFDKIGAQVGVSADAARKLWYRAIIHLQQIMHRKFPGLQDSSILRGR